MVRDVKTLEIPWWLQLSKRQILTFLPNLSFGTREVGLEGYCRVNDWFGVSSLGQDRARRSERNAHSATESRANCERFVTGAATGSSTTTIGVQVRIVGITILIVIPAVAVTVQPISSIRRQGCSSDSV